MHDTKWHSPNWGKANSIQLEQEHAGKNSLVQASYHKCPIKKTVQICCLPAGRKAVCSRLRCGFAGHGQTQTVFSSGGTPSFHFVGGTRTYLDNLDESLWGPYKLGKPPSLRSVSLFCSKASSQLRLFHKKSPALRTRLSSL